MTVTPIQSQEMRLIMHQAFEKIFVEPYEDNPATPFVQDVESKEFIYPILYKLNQVLFNALKKAAFYAGDTSFYLSLLDDYVEDVHWIISLENEDYFQLHLERQFSENAIYSPQGKWGILFYDDGRLVIGGKEEFIKMFFEALSSDEKEESIVSFLRDYGEHYKDCLIFLDHIYGQEKAHLLLNKYSLRPE